MNTNEHRKGQQVTILPTAHGNYLTADFPGWGTPDAHDHLEPAADLAGTTATVTSVNSHGSAPYTRYTLLLANGGRLIDATPGDDFTWGARTAAC